MVEIEIRKSKFNYVYIMWAFLTVFIAVIIIKNVLSISTAVA